MKIETKKIINSISKLSNFDSSNWKKELDENGYILIRNSQYMKNNLNVLRKKSNELIKMKVIKEDGKEKRNILKMERNLRVELKD